MRQFLRTILRILDGSPSYAMATKNRQRGQSMLELAFITPLLAILVAGAVEVGWYTNRWLSLLEITRVGARSATFLQGELSPLQWDNNASVHPDLQTSYLGIAPGETTYDAALNARDCISGREYGFYSFIACVMEESLSPLQFQTNSTAVDDLVISVFAIQTINNARHTGNEPGDASPNRPVYRQKLPLMDAVTPTDDLYKISYDLNAYGTRNDYPPGIQSVVIGRFPTNANECTYEATGDGSAIAGTLTDAHASFEYDPFDYLNPLNTVTVNPNTGGVEYVLELRNEETSAAYSDTANELQRGWAFLGQHRIDDTSIFCFGSEFTVREVEELMNMPNFIKPDLYNPPAGGPADPLYDDWVESVYATQSERLYFEPQGMTLVEVFWEHRLLLDFPLFRPLQEAYDDQMVISLWSAFPLPTVAPNIIYQLP